MNSRLHRAKVTALCGALAAIALLTVDDAKAAGGAEPRFFERETASTTTESERTTRKRALGGPQILGSLFDYDGGPIGPTQASLKSSTQRLGSVEQRPAQLDSAEQGQAPSASQKLTLPGLPSSRFGPTELDALSQEIRTAIRTCARSILSRQDREDIEQNVLTRLLGRTQAGPPPNVTNLPGYIYTVTCNETKDWAAHGRKQVAMLSTLAATDEAFERGVGVDDADSLRIEECIQRAIAGIKDEPTREIARLHYNEYRAAEISRASGIPVTTVKRRVGSQVIGLFTQCL